METVTVPLKEYKGLQDDSLLLLCLKGAGVDNWDGWDYALEMYQAASAEMPDES